MADSALPKDMKDYIPAMRDQGIDNLVGTPARGISIQVFQAAMPADGVLVFADNGIMDMADQNYFVMVHNHTGSNHGIVANADRLLTQIDVQGPTTDDILDVLIIGTVKDQLK